MLARYAVFALLDPTTAAEIRREQEALALLTKDLTALSFPVHVTLRGRFWGESALVGQAFEAVVQWFGSSPGAKFALAPAVHVDQWAWRELELSPVAERWLHEGHAVAEASCAPVSLQDEVAAAHRGRGFRPHVTLGWEVTPAVWGGCHDGGWSRQRDGAWVSAIALGQYPDSWPGGGTPVSLVRVAPLGPPPR